MAKLRKADVERVTKAFKWAQKRLGTAFVFGYRAAEDDDNILSIERTGRGDEDPDHYWININTRRLPKKWTVLCSCAVHEVIHAILWPLAEFAEDGRDDDLAEKANERAVYTLERAIMGAVASEGVR